MSRWREATIGAVCEVVAGQSPKGSYYNKDGDGLPFYQGKKEFGEKYIGAPDTWTRQTTREAYEGDILMSVRAPVGPINFATETICIGRGLAAIRAGDEISREFLFYLLLAKQDEIKGTEGAVYPSINKSQIQQISLHLPPLPEQERIVAILDEAFSAIATATANAEKNLANARELFESHLTNVFSQKNSGCSVEKRLVEVCSEFSRGKSRHRPRNEPSLYGGKYPFIQTGDISQADHEIVNYSQTYSEAGLAQSKLWPKGTICIAIVGATIGESGILNFDSCFPDSVIGMIVDPQKADTSYVEYMLQYYKPQIKAQGEGTARHNINVGTFQNLVFPIPPLPAQRQIVSKLKTLSRGCKGLRRVHEQKNTLLGKLKQSILHKAFTGELTAEPRAADRALAEAGV